MTNIVDKHSLLDAFKYGQSDNIFSRGKQLVEKNVINSLDMIRLIHGGITPTDYKATVAIEKVSRATAYQQIQYWRLHNKKIYEKLLSETVRLLSWIRSNIAYLLRSCYLSNYSFPLKSIQYITDSFSIMKKTTVYYDKEEGISQSDIEQLLTKREPVNIAMNRYYNQNRLKHLFGWDSGFYGEYYHHHDKLAPNITVYCKTPEFRTNHFIHVVHAIGYGFDRNTQPDYKYFIDNDNFSELNSRIYRVFHRIFTCAKEKGFRRVVLSQFGCSAFAGEFRKEIVAIWVHQLRNYLEQYGEELLEAGIVEISCFRLALLKYHTLRVPLRHFISDKYGNVPGVFQTTFEKGTLDETLFVNAWDPWSLVGNGNDMDNSLDGYFGRVTASALLCWPITNPYITYTKLS